MFFKFIHIVCISSLFLFIAAQYFIIWIKRNLFIHSSMVKHMSSYQFFSIINKAFMNILFLQIHIFLLVKYLQVTVVVFSNL